MIIDSSAIVAILKTEDDADVYAQALDSAGDGAWMSAATYVEISMVTDPLSVGVARSFAELMQESTIELLPFTPAQAHIARAAYRRYGRGSGHRARLNFGDCFSYALATERSEPLLFKGDDFSHTDVRSALD